MGAFIDSPQFHKRHFFGRHFRSPEVVYNAVSKLINERTRNEINSNAIVAAIHGRQVNFRGKKLISGLVSVISLTGYALMSLKILM